MNQIKTFNKELKDFNFFSLSNDRRLLHYRIGTTLSTSFLLGIISVTPFVATNPTKVDYILSGAGFILLPVFLTKLLKNSYKLKVFKKYSNYGIQYDFYASSFNDFNEINKLVKVIEHSGIIDEFYIDKLNNKMTLKFHTGLTEAQSWLQISLMTQIREIIGNNYSKFKV